MTGEDVQALERQLGRAPRALAGVAVRCPYGRPAVIAQHAYEDSGTPFPTTFYLTCPAAVAAVGGLEDAGGVARYEELVADDQDMRDSYLWGAQRQRELRRPAASMADGGASLTLGIAGTSRPGAVKCLHAHAAFGLADPGYALGRRVLAEAEPLYPPGRCCTA